jgi:hypothetical protein
MLFNPKNDNKFLFAQKPIITREMSKALLYTQDGIPYMSPELVLFCKSIYNDRKIYQLDFDVTVPLLSKEARSWLVNALKLAYPDGHRWSNMLL